MALREELRDFITSSLDNQFYYLLAFEDSGNNKFEVFVESYTKEYYFDLQKVVELSRKVNERFDRDVEDFELSISSAGLDLGFRDVRQYKKYQGDLIDIILKSGIKLKEVELVGVEDEYIEIFYQVKEKLEGQKKKSLVDKKEKINYSDIKETKKTVSYK